MAGPAIHYRTKYIRNDWWMFALYVTASLAISGIIGYAMRRDEIVAARVRAEHVARTLAVQFATEAATPGSDFAGTLPYLAQAMGEHSRLAVIETRAGDARPEEHYIGHSDARRVGRSLDPRDPDDKRALDLLTRASREHDHVAILWHEGVVNAAAVGTGGYTGIVDGLRPGTPSARPAVFALGTFLFLLVFGAGFQDVLYKLGQVINLAALGGVTFVAIRLSTALEPSLWRGVLTDPLVARAETLKLADIARIMAKDLPPQPSAITEWGARAVWGAVGFYVLALIGLWHRIGRVVGRDARAYRYVAPAFGTFAVCAGLPLVMGVGLAFWQSPGAGHSFVGLANFAALGKDTPSSPALWRTLLESGAWVAASATLQVILAISLALVVTQVRGRWRGLYRALFMIPWAIPGYIGALLWAHLWQHSSDAVFGWLQSLGLPGLAHPATDFAVNLLASAWMGAPLLMAVGVALLDRLTREQWETARLEGVTGLTAVRLVQWPLLRPLLIPGFAFALFWSLNAFAVVDLISGGGPEGATDLLVTRAYRWAFERIEYGYAAAWSVVAFALVAGLIVIVWREVRDRVPPSESSELVPALAFESR